MTTRYTDWRISEPVIATLADGSGFTVQNIDIFREVGGATDTRSLFQPGKFLTRAEARAAAISGAQQYISDL
jgi:hypothetical protein